MKDQNEKLKLILAYLLGISEATVDRQRDLDDLEIDPDVQALLERVERLFSVEDEPDWLEAMAAAREGLITPEIVQFLEDRAVWEKLDPDVVDQFDTLTALPPADAADLAPPYATFAEQLRVGQKKSPPPPSGKDTQPTWQTAQGFKWQHIKEKGQTIIRLVAETLTGSAQDVAEALQPPTGRLAYTGRGKSTGRTRFQIELTEDIEDLAVQIRAISQEERVNYFTITVDIDIPSRGGWPNLADIEVILKRGERVLASQVTDAYGEVIFEQVTRADLPHLSFEITPS